MRRDDTVRVPAPKVPDELPVSRLDGFSDGVLAIATTILVLELRLPTHGDQHLFRAILHEWPSQCSTRGASALPAFPALAFS